MLCCVVVDDDGGGDGYHCGPYALSPLPAGEPNGSAVVVGCFFTPTAGAGDSDSKGRR